MIVAVCAIIMLVLFCLEVPIYVSMLVASLVYFLATGGNLFILPMRMANTFESLQILAVPLFIFATNLMNYTGISKRIFRLADVLVGHMSGGMAQINILASTMMGGLSGSNLADAAMDCKMLVPQMTKRGYPKGFSAAVTAASALITPIIPPGGTLILFALVSGCSIGKLFCAGILPGIVMCICQMIIVSVISHKRGYRPSRARRGTTKELLVGLKDAILAIILVVVIIGGVRIGVFTATEAGAVACVYAMVVGTLVYREMTFAHFKLALTETVRSSAAVLMIIAAAKCFAYFISKEQVAVHLSSFMMEYIHSRVAFLIFVNVFLLIVGCFVEGSAILIITLPLMMPLVQAFDINIIQFGIIFVLNISIGTLTPPVGTVLYTTTQLVGCSIKDVFREGWQLYVALIISLILITFIPEISLLIPNLIY